MRTKGWRAMKVARRACWLALCLSVITRAGAAQGTDTSITLHVGGRDRTYLVHAPSGQRGHTLPLVVLLHGHSGTGAGMVRLTSFNAIADRAQFLVAYPDGVERSWADGRGITEADQQHVDDVAFFLALLDDIARRWPVDTTRVYAAGISNGGFMAERLACDAQGRLAGIGVVAATLSDSLVARCRLPRPVSVMTMHGTEDPLVPFEGGEVRGHRGRVQSAPSSAATWARWNHCTAAPTERAWPDTAGDGTLVSEDRYEGCTRGVAVVAFRITGGGHTWPGGPQYLTVRLVGRASRNLAGSEALWEFFAAHPR